MKKIFDAFIKAMSVLVGKKTMERLLIYSSKSMGVNLHLHGLIQIAGLSNYNSEINGEATFIKNVLPDLVTQNSDPVFFDIGANIGDYSLHLRKYFPGARLYAFEPVRGTYDQLVLNTVGQNIGAYNIGFGDKIGSGILYNTVNDTQTEFASTYKEIFQEVLKKNGEIASIEFEMDTVEHFCAVNQIDAIDFLKIDVEGHELSVLRGATHLLKNGSIKCIQFEFNAHHVYARVFLRDFYLFLDDFEFFRISNNGLIQLGTYNTYNEIFLLQNILAVRKDCCQLINAKYLFPPFKKP